jgi:hypothetical protein
MTSTYNNKPSCNWDASKLIVFIRILRTGRTGKNVVRLEALPCARNHSACDANVILTHSLRANSDYHFRLSVRDSRGDSTNVEATIRATNTSSVAALDNAFPRYTSLIMVREV